MSSRPKPRAAHAAVGKCRAACHASCRTVLGTERPTGRLRLNVPMSFGELFLRKPIAEYALAYPDVVVDVDFEDRRVHLIEEGFDLVVRIGMLEDSGLIATRVEDCPLYLCASPNLSNAMAASPTGQIVASRHHLVNSDGAPSWSCQDRSGQVHSHPLRPVFYANSAGMVLEAAATASGWPSCRHSAVSMISTMATSCGCSRR